MGGVKGEFHAHELLSQASDVGAKRRAYLLMERCVALYMYPNFVKGEVCWEVCV